MGDSGMMEAGISIFWENEDLYSYYLLKYKIRKFLVNAEDKDEINYFSSSVTEVEDILEFIEVTFQDIEILENSENPLYSDVELLLRSLKEQEIGFIMKFKEGLEIEGYDAANSVDVLVDEGDDDDDDSINYEDIEDYNNNPDYVDLGNEEPEDEIILHTEEIIDNEEVESTTESIENSSDDDELVEEKTEEISEKEEKDDDTLDDESEFEENEDSDLAEAGLVAGDCRVKVMTFLTILIALVL